MTNEQMQALSDILAEKGIRAMAEDAADIKEAWDLAFGEAVADRDTVFYDQFRWHLFSYEKLPAKCGEAAEQAHHEKVRKDIEARYAALTDEELAEYLRLTQKINETLERSE